MEESIILMPSVYYDNQPKRCLQCETPNPGFTFIKAINVQKNDRYAFVAHMFNCNACLHEFVLIQNNHNVHFEQPIKLVYEMEVESC